MITIFEISIPNFWLGFMLLAFAIMLPIFDVVDYDSFKLFRATILSNMNKDFITYVKARGLSNKTIVWNHLLKNSMPPMITVFLSKSRSLIAGSAIVERVFSWLGLGRYLVDAIIGRICLYLNCIIQGGKNERIKENLKICR